MRVMGIEAVYPKPRLSARGTGHKVYPYPLVNSLTVLSPRTAANAT
jgi:hypothetical protein